MRRAKCFPGDDGKETAKREMVETGLESTSTVGMDRILAWEIHGQRSLAAYSPWGCKRVGHDLATKERQPPHAALEQFLPVSPTQKSAAITQVASAMG